MKIAKDDTVEFESDGSVYFEEGDIVPADCPQCKSLFPVSDLSDEEPITCPKCGKIGNLETFSSARFDLIQ